MSISETFDHLRKYKILGLASPDLLALIFVVLIIGWYKSLSAMQTIIIFLLGLLLGIIVHYMIGKKTGLNYYLGISEKP